MDMVHDWEMGYLVKCSLLAGAVSAYALYKMTRKPQNGLPPGPTALPLIGNFYSFHTKDAMYNNLARWKEQYGDVFTVYIGTRPVVFLASADAIREALIGKAREFSGRLTYPSANSYSGGGKGISLAQPTQLWKMERTIAATAFRKYASGMPLVVAVETCVDNLRATVNKSTDKVMDITDIMLHMAYDFLSTVCFGKQFDDDDQWREDFMESLKEYIYVLGSGSISDFSPALKFFDRKKTTTLDKLMVKLHSFMDSQWEEHKQTFDIEQPRDLMDEILTQLEQQKQENMEFHTVSSKLTRQHLAHLLIDIFVAGTESTRTALSVIIGYMAQYPEIQAKLHEELDRVLGATGKLDVNTREKLPYTNAVIHESLRVTTIAPMGLPHITNCDTTLRKYKIPKGTAVVTYIHGVHNDPKNYKDSDTFRPERWIDESGQFQYQRNVFMPFSMGQRACVAETLARADLHLFTALLFHKYQFIALEDNFVVPTIKIRLAVETTQYKLKLKQRN